MNVDELRQVREDEVLEAKAEDAVVRLRRTDPPEGVAAAAYKCGYYSGCLAGMDREHRAMRRLCIVLAIMMAFWGFVIGRWIG